MKANLKKLLGGATLGLALLANTGQIWAGAKAQREVLIENGTSAYGTMNGARYSKDKKQAIGCRLYATPTFSNVFCAATDATGVFLSCFSTDPVLMDAASSITDSSFIYFKTLGNTQCSDIKVDNASSYLK